MFDPEWCSWTGGAPHFSFWNQMGAGHANFKVFARNLVPLLDAQGAQQLKDMEASFPAAAQLHLKQAMSSKLGLPHTHPAFEQLLQRCLHMMHAREADWTVFWRQLAELRGRTGTGPVGAAEVAQVMQPAFYWSGSENEPMVQVRRVTCDV